LQQRFWWATLEKDTREFVNACPVCNRHKLSHQAPAGFLQLLSVPIGPGLTSPWTLLLVSHCPKHTAILTVVDLFSKMAHFVPLPKLPSAKETAELVLLHVFRLHGLPTDVVSDRGPQFTSVFWREFCTFIGATVSLSSNSQIERKNQEMETALRCLVSETSASWSQQLLWVEYAHNTLTSSATGMFLFQCAYRFQPPLISALLKVSCPSVQIFVRCCHRTWAKARLALRPLLHSSQPAPL